MKKRGKDLSKLVAIVQLLVNDEQLEEVHKAHPLKGEWVPSWDLHIEPDWILIYQLTEDEVCLVRTGTHADLFD